MISPLLLLIAVWGACNADNGFTTKQQYEYFYEGVVQHGGGGVGLRCNLTVKAVTKNSIHCKLSHCQYAQTPGQPSGQVSYQHQYQYGQSPGQSSGQPYSQNPYQYRQSSGQPSGQPSDHYPYGQKSGQYSSQPSSQYPYGHDSGQSSGQPSSQHPYGQNSGQSSSQTSDHYPYQHEPNSGQSSGQIYHQYQYYPVPSYHNLHKPFNIEMKNGVLYKLKTEKNLPMWVTNVQKSVVSLFQLDIGNKSSQGSQNRLPFVYSTMEKSPYGDCETTYEVMSHDLTTQKQTTRKQLEDCYSRYNLTPPGLPMSPFTVIKSRNTDNCSVEAAHTYRYSPNYCGPDTECSSQTPMISHQSTYVLEGHPSQYTIYKVYVTSHASYDTYNKENKLYTVSEQTLLLKKKFPMGRYFDEDRSLKRNKHTDLQYPTLYQTDLRYSESVPSPQTSNSIPEFAGIHTMTRQSSERMTRVLESLGMIDSELNGFTAKNHGYVASAVIQAEEDMSYLDYKTLDDIKSSIESPTEKEIYYDLLALTGSSPAVEMLISLIEQHHMSTHQASRVISLLSSQMKTPSFTLMKRLDQLRGSDFVKDNVPVRLNLAMTMGNLFYRACVQSKSYTPSSPEYVDGYYCSQNVESLMKEFITKTEKEIEHTKLPEKLALIQSIGNVGSPDIMPVMQHLIDSANNKQTVSQAIYSLKRLSKTHCKNVQDITSAIFWNTYIANEVRVAAVTMQLTCNPPLHYWKKLAMSTWNEPSEEVQNFVSSAIESYANTEDDSLRSQKRNAQQCLSLIKHKNKNWYQSQKYDFGSVIKNFVPGATGRTSLVTGTHTNIPKTIYMSLKNFIGGFANGEGKVILNGAGVNHVIDEIFSSLNGQVGRRRWSPDGTGWPEGMQRVMQQLQASRPEDIVDPSLSILTSWNQYIQSFYQFDTSDYYNLKMGMRSDYSSQLKPTQAIYYLQDQVYSRPSEIGIPTYYSEKVPLVLSLRGQVNFEWRPSRSSLQLTMTDATPTVMIYRRSSLQIANPFSSIMVEVGEENSFHMSAPIDANFQIDFETQQLQTSVQLREEQPDDEENFQLHFHRVPYSRSATYDPRSGLGSRRIYATSPVCHYHPEIKQHYGQPNLDNFSQQRDHLCDIQKSRAYHADYNLMSRGKGVYRFETALTFVDGNYQTPEQDQGLNEKQQQYSKVQSTIVQARQILNPEQSGSGAAVVAVTSLFGRSPRQYTAILASKKGTKGRSFNTVFSDNDEYTCFNLNFERPKEEQISGQYRYRAQVYGDLSHGHNSCSQPGLPFKTEFTSKYNYRSAEYEQGRDTCYQPNGQAGCHNKYRSAIEEIKLNVDLSKLGEDSIYIQSFTDSFIDSMIGEYGVAVQHRRSRPDQMNVYARVNYDQGNIMVSKSTAFGLKTYQLPLPIESGRFEDFTMMHKSEQENWDNLMYGRDKTMCSLSRHQVTSFDGNMVNMRDSDCQVVLTHCLFCSSKVLITSNLKPDNREVHIFVEDHEVVLRRGPHGSPYDVEIDSQVQKVPDDSVLRVFDESSSQQYIKVERSYQTMYVSLVQEKMQVVLNQVSGQVRILANHPRYGGSLQGVCGNMDGESRNDMVDQQQCVHTDEQTFADSYRVSVGTSSPEYCYPRRLPAPLCSRLNYYSTQLYSPAD